MMAAAGVPVVPGYHGADQSEDRSALAEEPGIVTKIATEITSCPALSHVCSKYPKVFAKWNAQQCTGHICMKVASIGRMVPSRA